MATPDFSKIWSSNSSLTPYTWSDADYLKGWETVGNIPPSRQQFDAVQKQNDTKMKFLYDSLNTESAADAARYRQPSTAYASGTVMMGKGFPADWLLVCTQAGTTGSGNLAIPSTLIDGAVITDGNAKWKLNHIATFGGLNYLQPSKAYTVGTIAYCTDLPSYYRLECITAGTTASTAPSTSGATAGSVVTYGTAKFIVDDMRDGTPVGSMRPSVFLPAGYVKLEGATVNRSNYPRLVALANQYSLWTSDPTNNPGLFGNGNGSTTMVLPNWKDRMAQFASMAGAKADAGLPDINGYFAGFGIGQNDYGHLTDFEENPVFFRSTEASADSAIQLLTSKSSSDPAYHMKLDYYSDTYTNLMTGVNLRASRNNAIYGKSTTVQPSAIKVFAIMRY